jgi:hypothetical protein
MFGETITHTGAFETLNGIMIMLGFNTTMSGKTTIDQKESSRAVGNQYLFLFKTISSQRGNIETRSRKVSEVREPMPFIITTIIKLVNQNLDRTQKVPEEK